MKGAVIYSRVSTPMQAEEDKTSLGEQTQRCRQHCQEKDYRVIAEYSDVCSGTTKNRPGFLRMLKDAREGKFEVIVAWKTDRLARGIYPCAALMEALESTSITIETVAEPFDRTTFEIRAVLGRIEVENFVQRSLMGKEAKIRGGNHHTRAPFGYDYNRDTHRWVINESQAEWVRQIFTWYIEGLSSGNIAQRLNEAGVPTKHQSRLGWAEKTVSLLVSRECYAGTAYYNKGRRKKARDPDKWVSMPVPPIITTEMWEAAQARRARNKQLSPRNTRAVYLTQHVLRCEECGTSFYISPGWNGRTKMMCQRMLKYPHLAPCRIPKTVRYEKVAHQLWDGIVGVIGTEAGLEAAIRSNVERVTLQRKDIEKRLRELTEKRSGLKLEQDHVITWARKGSISEEQLDRQLKAIQAEDERWAAEQDRLLADLRLLSDSEIVYQRAEHVVPGMRDRLNGELSEEEKRDIIDLLVRRALLDGDGNLTIEFKVPSPEKTFGFHSYSAGSGTWDR